MTVSQTDSNPLPKRRRTANPAHQACSACKARKVRCDSCRPQCSACAANGKPCEYPPVYQRASCSKQYVDELETKLKHYERLLESAQVTARHAAPAATASYVAQGPAPPGGSPGEDDGAAPPMDRQLPHKSPGAPGSGAEGLPATTDAPIGAQFTNNSSTPTRETAAQTAPGQQGSEARPLEVQAARDQENDGDDFVMSGTTTPAVDDDNDDDATSVIDGIAEFAQPSPGSSKRGEAFGDSSTFNFAFAMAASKDSKQREGEDARLPPLLQDDIRTPHHGFGSAVTMSPYLDLLEKERLSMDDEMATSLHAYLNQSSLQYLPQRHAASKLLQKYFTDVHPIWPFIIEKEARAYFDKTWSSDEAPNPVWIAQLNLIFALACQFYEADDTPPLPNIAEAGKQFYLRGSGYVIANAHRRCNIPLLQSLLMAAQYQQGTMRAGECWLTIGTATRMALGLGLHEPMSDSVPPLCRELCKRLWWGCFALDRVSSMVYGRPVGIPHMGHTATSSDFPSLADDAFTALGQPQPEDQPSVNAFFHSVTKLYHVMDEILDSLQDASRLSRMSGTRTPCSQATTLSQPSGDISALPLLTSLLRLDDLLCKWHSELPRHLRFSLDGPDNTKTLPPVLQRQMTILKMRFTGMRILLHRQSLLYLLQAEGTRVWPRNASRKWPPLFSDVWERNSSAQPPNGANAHQQATFVEIQLARLSAGICVQMAQLQIRTIDAGRKIRITGAWWWDLHFTFNSLCVLFAALGVPKADLSAICPDLANLKSTIRRGFRNVREMAIRGGPKVAQSERFLRALLKTMTNRGNEQHLNKNDPTKEALSNLQSSFNLKTPFRRDAHVAHADSNQGVENKAYQPGLGFEAPTAANDAGFLDAFDFLLSDQTSSLWPGTGNIMDWENSAPQSDGGSMSSFLRGSFDAGYPCGSQSPTFGTG